MNGGHRPLVTGVHGLQHVQHLAATTFSYDNPIWPHAQRVLDQIARQHLATPFDIRRARLQTNHVSLLHLQLGGVLYVADKPLS